MRVAIACDHRGFEPKRKLIPLIKRLGHEVEDFGTENANSCDYPDFAHPLAQSVAAGKHDAGILLDGVGVGMCIVANKVRGVRAASIHDPVTARIAREQNHCNILCLGTDLLSEEQLRSIVEIFLSTPFTDGRHARRVAKIVELESQNGSS